MTPHPCPRCGTLMNRHAEKLVTPPDAAASPQSAVFDGVIERHWLCPNCHWIESEPLP
jgi:ribosomal protein S27AE